MSDHEPAWSFSRRFVLKTAFLLLAILCRSYLPYLLIGLWNRIFGGWHSVFYCYAGNESFITSYAAPATEEAFRWVPCPIGVLRQGRTRGIVLASPVTERAFLDPANEREFRRLRKRLRLIARLVGTRDIKLAGILPGVLRDDDVLTAPDSRQIVVPAVIAAVMKLVAERFAGMRPPIIALGGSGFIGAPITAGLSRFGYEVHVVDPKSGRQALPGAVRGQRSLLVDLSRAGVISGYIDQMWQGLVVLNEAFPQPSRRDMRAMNERGVEVHHLSGVKGSIFPPLPFGYANAVPCCAAHRIDGPQDVRLVRLGAERKDPARSRPALPHPMARAC